MITGLFIDAVYGKYHDERRVITRDEFNDLKDTDAYVKYIWSFGNNGLAYLWGKNIEDIKCQACRMLMGAETNERRLEYRQFIKMLSDCSSHQSLDRLQSVEHLQALTQLEALQRLEVSNIDYRDYKYKKGDVVYCDVPYEVLGKDSCDDYGLTFDSLAFYEWAKAANIKFSFQAMKYPTNPFIRSK